MRQCLTLSISSTIRLILIAYVDINILGLLSEIHAKYKSWPRLPTDNTKAFCR